LKVDEARRLAASFPPNEVILGGERRGLAIEGFDLGNSPAEYTPAVVAGKTVVLTTTNGTRALLHCHQASEILIGAFVNLSALCAHLDQERAADVDVVCAGTDSQVTWDDVLLAGALAEQLHDRDWRLDDSACIARDAWRTLAGSAAADALESRLVGALANSRGGRNLLRIGMAHDVALAAEIDRFAVVPRFDPGSGRVEVVSS
jgi:2-phosphosulfolactate phosphatase